MHPVHSRTRGSAVAFLTLMALVVGLSTQPAPAQAEELVDLTLMFHSAVQGKIAPCG